MAAKPNRRNTPSLVVVVVVVMVVVAVVVVVVTVVQSFAYLEPHLFPDERVDHCILARYLILDLQNRTHA